MNIVVNGEKKNIEKQLNLHELLKKLDLPDERIAVELNKQVVRKKDWDSTKVNDADKIEIIHFVGGG
jgi:sulfur carrier protein